MFGQGTSIAAGRDLAEEGRKREAIAVFDVMASSATVPAGT